MGGESPGFLDSVPGAWRVLGLAGRLCVEASGLRNTRQLRDCDACRTRALLSHHVVLSHGIAPAAPAVETHAGAAAAALAGYRPDIAVPGHTPKCLPCPALPPKLCCRLLIFELEGVLVTRDSLS